MVVPSIPIEEKNRLSLVVDLSLVTGEFITYRNNDRGLTTTTMTTTRTILSILLFLPYYLRNPLKRRDITMGPRVCEPFLT
jgi:hypothetical protein